MEQKKKIVKKKLFFSHGVTLSLMYGNPLIVFNSGMSPEETKESL